MKNIKYIQSSSGGVTLTALAEQYMRWDQGVFYRATASGVDYIDALKNLVDKMGLYLDPETIDEMLEEDPSLTFEDLIDNIESTNGDGCDFIIALEDNHGHTFIGGLEER